MLFNQTQKQQLIAANLALKSLDKRKNAWKHVYSEIVIGSLIIIQSLVNILNQIKLTDF